MLEIGKHNVIIYKVITNAIASSVCVLFFLSPLNADIYKSDTIKIYGDFRTRVEADFASQTAVGIKREDRSRIRIRARIGFNYLPDNYWDFGMRLRSGSDNSQQSPHITILDFDQNDTGDSDFNFDKWYLKGKFKGGSVWVGRNSLPYWKQNELFWDDDVTPAGTGGTYKIFAANKNILELNAGYFSLPAGMKAFSGQVGEVQAVLHSEVFTLAGGLLNIQSNPLDPDGKLLLRGNGARDYRTWIVSGQLRLNAAGRMLKVGADFMKNSKDYSVTDPDPNTANNFDQTTGYDIFVMWGDTRPDHWLFGYTYANIEALAINSSYVQDDWVRWGSATQNRATDMRGSEYRVAYALSDKQNFLARLYIAESIKTIEDGKRIRVDWNMKF